MLLWYKKLKIICKHDYEPFRCMLRYSRKIDWCPYVINSSNFVYRPVGLIYGRHLWTQPRMLCRVGLSVIWITGIEYAGLNHHTWRWYLRKRHHFSEWLWPTLRPLRVAMMPILSLLVTSEVIATTTSAATSDDKVGITITQWFQSTVC